MDTSSNEIMIGEAARYVIRLARTHWAAIVLALMVGIVSIAPHVYFAAQEGYADVALMGADAEEHYLARVQEVNDGYPTCGDVFSAHKDEPYMIPCLGEVIQAYAGRALHLPVPVFNIALKFLAPFAVVLLFYAMAYELFKTRKAALLGSAIATIGYNLLSGPADISAFLHFTSVLDGFLTYTRPINPGLSTPVMLIGSLFLLRAFFREGKRARWWEAALVGTCAGIDVYISIYPATFLFGMAGLTMLYYTYRHDWQRVRSLIVTLGVGAALSIPFIINYFQLTHTDFYLETALRQGLVVQHTPVFSTWLFILLFVVLFLWPKRFAMARPFFVLATLTLLILTQQHVITGVFLQPQHYHWYITKPLVALVVGMYGAFILDMFFTSRAVRLVFVSAGLAVLFLNAIALQLHSYNVHAPEATQAQRYAPALRYLAASPEDNVWADKTLSSYIPIYTNDNAVNSIYAPLYLSPQQYHIDRLLLEYKLRGVAPNEILAVLQNERAYVSMATYSIYWREQAGSYAAIPDEILAEYAARYQYIYDASYPDIFRSLGADVIVWDEQAESGWHISDISSAREIFSANGIRIYKLDREQ